MCVALFKLYMYVIRVTVTYICVRACDDICNDDNVYVNNLSVFVASVVIKAKAC